MKWLKTLAVWLVLASTAVAKYPYDSVGRVAAGGSTTMIYVAENKGLMVTCAHVVEGVSETKVYWPAVKAERLCKTVYVNKNADIAYLVCDNPPVAAVPIKEIKSGSVVAAGFPYYDRTNLHWQFGVVLQTDEFMVVMTNRPVAGMSGGAGFDDKGNLVGIVRQYNPLVGGMVGNAALVLSAAIFADPESWVPSDAHVEQHKKWKLADQNGDVRTFKYDEKTAPDLMPVLK